MTPAAAPLDPGVLARPGTVLLDTGRPDAENRQRLLFTAPHRILRADDSAGLLTLLDELDRALAAGHYVAGYLAYEAGLALEPALPDPQPGEELAWFGVYDTPRSLSCTEISDLVGRPGDHRPQAPEFAWEREAYAERIRSIKASIRAGDVYQINFTGPLRFRFAGEAAALYAQLRAKQRVAYGGYLNPGDHTLLSLSPELFFRRSGRRIETRPMKGTIRRGRTLAEDRALAEQLAADGKSRAENLMIVDLLRNDLSVVCEAGSVRVPKLFTTEPYDTLIQMTSTVEGRLRAGTTLGDIVRALFPCGSVTGAPKIRAMQEIGRLEATRRGVYCGAIGYAGPDATAAFSVAIRTVVLAEEEGTMGIGSGIVWDSDAEAEYEECLLKGRFLTDPMPPAFDLIETMRAEGGVVPLLELHLDRLQDSAAYFGVPFDRCRLRDQAEALARSAPPGSPARLRVLLGREGEVQASASPVEAMGRTSVVLAEARIDPAVRWFYHKTTCRALYEVAYERAREGGWDEVLFLNTRGELTEGSRTNVFLELEEGWATPPVSSGLLPGVYRRHLLETLPGARERVLTLDDLRHARSIVLCNAVWGAVEGSWGGAWLPGPLPPMAPSGG